MVGVSMVVLKVYRSIAVLGSISAKLAFVNVNANGLLDDEIVKSVALSHGEAVMIQVKFASACEGEEA